MHVLPATTFGLDGWSAKLVLIAMVIAGAAVIFAVMRWLIPKLLARVPTGSDPVKSRNRHTAAALLATMVRYLVLVGALVAIVIILAGGSGIEALGGSAILAVIIGFASQRLLADMIAGFFILFEGQYGVGDVITVHPTGLTGVVEEVGVRTTVLRTASGDRSYIPNGQISAIRRFPSARSVLSVTLITRDPDTAEAVLSHLDEVAPAGSGIAATARDLRRRDVGNGLTAVLGRVAVASMLLEPAQELVSATLQARLGEALAAPPVVVAVEPRKAEEPAGIVEE